MVNAGLLNRFYLDEVHDSLKERQILFGVTKYGKPHSFPLSSRSIAEGSASRPMLSIKKT